MNWGAWSGCTSCSGYAQSGAKALLAWLLECYPSSKSLGIYNCRVVSGSGSLSIHSCGRAVDLWLPYVNGQANPVGHKIVQRVGAHGVRLGAQAAIFDRRIWSAVSPNSRLYTGVHPHYDHIHFELTPAAGSNLTLATLRAVLGGPLEEDEDVKELVTGLQMSLNAAGWTDHEGKKLTEDGIWGGRTQAALTKALTAQPSEPTPLPTTAKISGTISLSA